MKSIQESGLLPQLLVAPFTGAWIEIGAGTGAFVGGAVAPFTGAWIEITLER